MTDKGKAAVSPDRKNRAKEKDNTDYLINQDSFTCLTVLNGSGPKNAEIGAADCYGRLEQQWIFDGNSLLWGGDPSYCLVPNYEDEVVTLGDVSTSKAEWIHDEKDRFVVDGKKAIQVPHQEKRTIVILHHIGNGVAEKWWTHTQLDAMLVGASPAVYPVVATDITTYNQELARGLNNHLAPVTDPMPYERDIITFPGLVAEDTPRVNRTVILDLLILGQVSNLRMAAPQDWQATELYAASGDVIEIVLPSTLSIKQASQIQVRIGANNDFLQPDSGNVEHKNKWIRMPIVTETFVLAPGVNKIRGQYGGNLIFMFSEGENFTVEVEVRNVVEAPYFKLGETTIEQWQQAIKREVPRALFEGNKAVVVVSKTDATDTTNPDKLMNRYDDVISMLNYAAGFDEMEPPPRGKYWLVNDIEITAGSAHAGFPAMFNQKYTKLASLDTPHDWVTWHELGHNYQQRVYWESTYGSESTVNLYSLYIQRQLFDEDRLENKNKYVETADAVDAGLTFDDGDSWQKLVFLMEIYYAFPEQGWEIFRQLRKTTRALSEEDAEILKHNEQNRFDYVYKNISKIVGSDLIKTYKRWSITISQEAKDEIGALGLPKAPADLSHRTSKKK